MRTKYGKRRGNKQKPYHRTLRSKLLEAAIPTEHYTQLQAKNLMLKTHNYELIRLLEDKQKTGPLRDTETILLANAYAEKKQPFLGSLIESINQPEIRDYLLAKRAYIEDNKEDAVKLLRPYINEANTPETLQGST